MRAKGLLAAVFSMALLAAGRRALAGVFITEFCSDTGNNQKFEFVEFTNVGVSSVDMTGWSEDDSNATANRTGHSLSGLGTLMPGESGIFTEADPTAFRDYWGLSASVKVIGPYTNDNLNTMSDSITLFDNTGTLVDRLDYSTTNGGSADMVTRDAPLSALGKNENGLWVNSFIGDAFGSYGAPQKPAIVGNPGLYRVPEPATIGVMGGVLVMMGRRRRRLR